MFSTRVRLCCVYAVLDSALAKMSKPVFLDIRDERLTVTRVSATSCSSPTNCRTEYKRFDVAPQIVASEHPLFKICECSSFLVNRVPKSRHIIRYMSVYIVMKADRIYKMCMFNYVLYVSC